MSESTFTTCDECNVTGLVHSYKTPEVYEYDIPNQLIPAGWTMSTAEQALKNGWEECDYGHLCPECASEKKAQAERDEAEDAWSIVGLELPGRSEEES